MEVPQLKRKLYSLSIIAILLEGSLELVPLNFNDVFNAISHFIN